jgi:hypothetical protein
MAASRKSKHHLHMPKGGLVKGSVEAREYMAKLRSMKKSKPKGKTSKVKSTSPRRHSRKSKSKPKMKSRKSRKSRK